MIIPVRVMLCSSFFERPTNNHYLHTITWGLFFMHMVRLADVITTRDRAFQKLSLVFVRRKNIKFKCKVY